jgi:predicted O-methyltransferase YrrM
MTDNIDLFRKQFERTAEYLEASIPLDIANELENSNLIREIEKKVSGVDGFLTKEWNHSLDLGIYRAICYLVARLVKPNTYIETGVLHGLTSSFILEGLRKNDKGKLISIDFPSYFGLSPANNDGHFDCLPSGKEPGWLIPDYIRENWELHLGKSSDVLPKILSLNNEIDIFLHDSEHTYQTMFLEFELAWPKLREGGILIADNIIDNTAFFDFCSKVSGKPLIYSDLYNHITSPHPLPVRFGILQKK